MIESAATDSTLTSSTAKPPSAGSSPAAGTRQSPTWLTPAALLIAVIAVLLAVIGWFRPSAGGGSFSDQQTQDAKTQTCAAVDTVRSATNFSTNMRNPVRGNKAGALAVAANARLALFAGGGYLRERLAAEPATPADLGKTVSSLADTMQALAINYLAGAAASDAVQQPLRDELKSQLIELRQLCK